MTRVHHPPPAATSLSSIGRSICQAYAGVNALPSTAQPRPELEVNRLARAPRRATLRDVGVAGSNPVTPTIEFIHFYIRVQRSGSERDLTLGRSWVRASALARHRGHAHHPALYSSENQYFRCGHFHNLVREAQRNGETVAVDADVEVSFVRATWRGNYEVRHKEPNL